MHYVVVWGLAYLVVSFVVAICLGKMFAFSAGTLPEPAPVPVRVRIQLRR